MRRAAVLAAGAILIAGALEAQEVRTAIVPDSVTPGDVFRAAIRVLVPIRGRKPILLLSAGFLEDPDLRDAAATARAGNATVYFVDVRGLAQRPFSSAASAVSPALADFARTGGVGGPVSAGPEKRAPWSPSERRSRVRRYPR